MLVRGGFVFVPVDSSSVSVFSGQGISEKYSVDSVGRFLLWALGRGRVITYWGSSIGYCAYRKLDECSKILDSFVSAK